MIELKKSALKTIGILEIFFALVALLSFYKQRPHSPSPLDSLSNLLNSGIFSNFSLFLGWPPLIHLIWVGMTLGTGVGLLFFYRWAWWAELNLLGARIIYSILMLIFFEGYSRALIGGSWALMGLVFIFYVVLFFFISGGNFKSVLKFSLVSKFLMPLTTLLALLVLGSQILSDYQMGLF